MLEEGGISTANLCSVIQPNTDDAVNYNNAMYVFHPSSDKVLTSSQCIVLQLRPCRGCVRRGCRYNICMFVHSIFSHLIVDVAFKDRRTRLYRSLHWNLRILSMGGRHLNRSTNLSSYPADLSSLLKQNALGVVTGQPADTT